jgi:hypothetical protein
MPPRLCTYLDKSSNLKSAIAKSKLRSNQASRNNKLCSSIGLASFALILWLVAQHYLIIGGFLALCLKLKLFNLTGIAGGYLFPSLRSGTYPKGVSTENFRY